MDYGIQLYSVRDLAEVNFEAALRQMAAQGYTFVETAGFFGHSAEQVKQWLDRYGLRISGTHSSFEDLERDFEGTVTCQKAIGSARYIVPWSDTTTREALERTAEKMRKFAPMLAEHGITLGYHNHDFEFLPNADGICPMDYFREHTDVQFEIDVFWAYVAGKDPVSVLEEWKDRLIGCIHLKDGFRSPAAEGRSLGLGGLPIRDVIAKCKELGLAMVVESEDLNPSGVEEAARCARFLAEEG